MVCPHPRLLLVAAVVSFCSNWQFAFQITYVNTSVNTFFNLTNNGYRSRQECFECTIPAATWSSTWSTVVSSFYPGAILGFLLTPYLTSRLGVKRTQIVTCFPAILGCLVHFLAHFMSQQNEYAVSLILIIGRFLIGIQSGASLCLLPLYIIEVSPEQHRAFLSTFQQVSQALGTLLGLLIGSEDMLPLGAYRFFWLQLFAVGPTILFLVVHLLTPKTPMWLMREGDRTVELVESLTFYHGSTQRLDSVHREVHGSPTTQRKMVKQNSVATGISSTDWKGFFIGAAAAVSYGFTGDDLIDTFSSQILTKSDQSTSTADVMSVAFGALLFISSLFGTFLIDRFSRRGLLIFGLIGTALSNASVVIAPSNFILVTVGFAMTKVFIGLGAGAPAWFLTSELVSPTHVTLFQSLSTGLLLSSNMLVTFFYMQLDYLIGNYSMLVLASGPSLILALSLYLFLPETKDKTNPEVQKSLSDRTLSGFRKVTIEPKYYGALPKPMTV